MGKVYFVRHGESVWNVENKLCGRTDVALTEKGMEQARETGREIVRRGISAEEIICSPLQRARDTAAEIAAVTGIPMRTDERLIEQYTGYFEGMPRNSEEFREEKKEFAAGLGGGESALRVAQRIYNLLDEIRDSGKNIILVSHNGIARVINSYFEDMSSEAYARFGVRNCEVKEYEFGKTAFIRFAKTDEMREMDRLAIEERGIPSLQLMDNASVLVKKEVIRLLRETGTDKVSVLCGTGNNGGDGYACAWHLLLDGIQTRVFLVGSRERLTKDAEAFADKFESAGGVIEKYQPGMIPQGEIIVDALFGVGLNRGIGGLYREAIEEINRTGSKVVSCDIPSGIHGDSGEVMGCAVNANVTVTFSCAKPGLFRGAGRAYTGKLVIGEIGIPEDLLPPL